MDESLLAVNVERWVSWAQAQWTRMSWSAFWMRRWDTTLNHLVLCLHRAERPCRRVGFLLRPISSFQSGLTLQFIQKMARIPQLERLYFNMAPPSRVAFMTGHRPVMLAHEVMLLSKDSDERLPKMS